MRKSWKLAEIGLCSLQKRSYVYNIKVQGEAGSAEIEAEASYQI